MKTFSLTMISKHFILIASIVIYTLGYNGHESSAERILDQNDVMKIQMPGVRAQNDDEYLCTQLTLPNEDLYLVEFGAVIDVGAVHHMLLFGCSSSPSNEPYRKNCFGPCTGGGVIYAWGRNAPPTKLPQDVAFHVGKDSGIKTLVLQVHYRTPMAESDHLDHSGVSISFTRQRTKYLAGVYLLVSGYLTIPAHSPKVTVDASCKFNHPSAIHPFAFRTHAHDLGRVISGYVYKNSKYELIGKGNPQWPQAFYPVGSPDISIEKGDIIVARCTYNASERDTNTKIGEGHSDEMCNFYIMYYTEAGESSYVCPENQFPTIARGMPASADQLLPPNPLLDEAGSSHAHHSPMKGMTGHQHEKGEESGEKHPAVNSGDDLKELVVEENWPSVASSVTFGQISGVAVDQGGNVHIFHRGSRVWDQWSFDNGNNFKFSSDGPIKAKTLVELDNSTGKIITEWGDHSFYMPHGLHIDHEGKFWVTDVALHQVLRFDKGSSKPSLVLGEPFVPGRDSAHFCKPTDVVTLDSGEFFVADGYCNHRIVKFSKDGKYITEFGGPPPDGAAYPQGTLLRVPHSLTIVRKADAGDDVCAADRENARIVCYTITGAFSRQFKRDIFQPALFAIDYSPASGLMYGVTGVGGISPADHLTGFGINISTSTLSATFKPPEKGFYHPHDISISPDGRCIYVVEIGPNKIWKFHQTDLGDTNSTSHQSVKKALVHHPISSDESVGEMDSTQAIRLKMGYLSNSWGMTVVVVSLLVVPVTLILAVAICLKMKKKGLKCHEGSKNRRFNPGNLLNRHNGFSLLRTMDNYTDSVDESTNQELEPLNSDESEVEEFSTRAHLQKA